MTRNQYNLYISNISDTTNEDCLISFFSQFGKIENYTYFPKSFQRQNTSVMITYGLSVNVNEIIENYQRILFNGRNLVLRRTLPSIRPPFERVMISNQLIISFNYLSTNKEFNEINIRNYFSKYGPIISCRIVIIYTTYLINFLDSNSVDSAILDEPHFYNNNELILRKYLPPHKLEYYQFKEWMSDEKNQSVLIEKIRRLKHIIEAYQFGYKIELKLIKHFYQEKITKCINIINYVERIKQKNQSLKLIIEQNQQMKKSLHDLYKIKIQNQQNRMNQLIDAINLLTLY